LGKQDTQRSSVWVMQKLLSSHTHTQTVHPSSRDFPAPLSFGQKFLA